jgi:hypothetical protein
MKNGVEIGKRRPRRFWCGFVAAAGEERDPDRFVGQAPALHRRHGSLLRRSLDREDFRCARP